jgi:LuxR family quorum-sensing system transcriptional regulator CciR
MVIFRQISDYNQIIYSRLVTAYEACAVDPALLWCDAASARMSLGIAGLVDQFDALAGHCASQSDLARLVEDAARELGFVHFALLHHASLAPGRVRLIRIDNYPHDWVSELVREAARAEDPVHLASGRTNLGFPWEQLDRLVPLTARHRDILERGRRHDIGAGFTVPANVPGEPAGSCSFAVRRGRELPARHLLCAELIGAHAFGAARRLHDFPAGGGRPHLSRRERECLRLAAAGKSDWEIGRILGVAEATARQYVKRARAAYDVATRTQLVVHGLRDGWIGFGEAIPPNGGMG